MCKDWSDGMLLSWAKANIINPKIQAGDARISRREAGGFQIIGTVPGKGARETGLLSYPACDTYSTPILAHPTLEEIQCPSDHYAGWDGDPLNPAVCIPYDVVAPPGGAIPDLPIPPLAPAPGTTSECPRGSAYDKPWFGFGGCDPGYVSSSGALVQGMGAQCICAETPEGRQVTQTPAEGEYQPDDTGLGGLMKMLPQLIMVLVVVQIIGAFRK